MNRLLSISLGIALSVAACSKDSTTAPSAAAKPILSAALLPANEVPPVSGPEATGSGSVTVTWDLTKDASGNITAAKATFNVSLAGFPAGTPINIAHIHEGPSTCVCPIRVNTTLTAGELVL